MPLAGRPPTGANSRRSTTSKKSSRRRPTSCPRSSSAHCEAGAANRLRPGCGEGLRPARKTYDSEGCRGLAIPTTTGPAHAHQRQARARTRLTDRKTVAEAPFTRLSSRTRYCLHVRSGDHPCRSLRLLVPGPSFRWFAPRCLPDSMRTPVPLHAYPCRKRVSIQKSYRI